MPPQMIPDWLRAADDSLYFRKVLFGLLKREKKRITASATQPQELPSPSLSQRLLGHNSKNQPQFTEEQILSNRYSIREGKKPENADANRYMDILPYDRTRVVLPSSRNRAPRYLNASWVREKSGGRWWIAGQAPLTHTVYPFLSLLKTALAPEGVDSSSYLHPNPTRIRTVVQLTRNIERGIAKGNAYFSPNVGRWLIVPPEAGSEETPFKVELLETETLEPESCVVSLIRVLPSSEDQVPLGGDQPSSFMFRHLLYGAWPDHGVPEPEDRDSFLHFVRLVERLNKEPIMPPNGADSSSSPYSDANEDSDPPIFVHCSAGVGRTGTYLAITSLLRYYGFLSGLRTANGEPVEVPPLPPSPLGALPRDLQDDLVAQEVDSLREHRPGMVQRLEQLEMIYEVLQDAFTAPTNPNISG